MLTSTTRAFINEQQYGGKKKMKNMKKKPMKKTTPKKAMAKKKPMKKLGTPKKQGY